MENSFESGGVSSAPSMPVNSGPDDFGTAAQGSFTEFESSGFSEEIYPKGDGGIFEKEEIIDLTGENNIEEKSGDREIMDIPGTAHEKLVAFAEESDQEVEVEGNGIDAEAQGKIDEDTKTEDVKEENKLTLENQVIKIQAETLKLLAQSINGELNKKELEELIKKLKKLLEELEESKGTKKETLISGVFAVLTVLLQIGDQGYKKLEKEVNEAQE